MTAYVGMYGNALFYCILERHFGTMAVVHFGSDISFRNVR